jgi:hypothetical protein
MRTSVLGYTYPEFDVLDIDIVGSMETHLREIMNHLYGSGAPLAAIKVELFQTPSSNPAAVFATQAMGSARGMLEKSGLNR